MNPTIIVCIAVVVAIVVFALIMTVGVVLTRHRREQ